MMNTITESFKQEKSLYLFSILVFKSNSYFMPGHMPKIADIPIYGKNSSQIFGTKGLVTLCLGINGPRRDKTCLRGF